MSQFKPEVGDVWKNNYGELAHIIYSDHIVIFVRKYWITDYEYHYSIDRLDLNKFLRKYTNTGKSKVKLEELFDVAED